MSSTRLHALRLASGLITLALLPKFLDPGTNWRLFGSWAILLQSSGQMRLPNDVDIELISEAGQEGTTAPNRALRTGGFGLQLGEARMIQFSNPDASPVSYWQTAKILHRNRAFSEETVNWVHREPGTSSDEISQSAQHDGSIDLKKSDAFITALEELPDLASLPPIRVPSASREECVAQKWTRIATTRSGERRHTRWQDLADVYDLVTGTRGTLQNTMLSAWLRKLALKRGLEWPCVMPPPPAEWLDFWDSYNYRSGTPRPSPERCARELNAYLEELATS